MSELSKLSQRVRQIYDSIGSQVAVDQSLKKCMACGECCDFAKFGHLLFVSTPEMIFLKENIGQEKIKQMETNVCPYNERGKCTIYPLRFAGCRIFFCKGNGEFQGQLSETTIKSFKALCTEFDIPYKYKNLQQALKEL